MYMYSMQLNLPQLINLLLRYMYRSFFCVGRRPRGPSIFKRERQMRADEPATVLYAVWESPGGPRRGSRGTARPGRGVFDAYKRCAEYAGPRTAGGEAAQFRGSAYGAAVRAIPSTGPRIGPCGIAARAPGGMSLIVSCWWPREHRPRAHTKRVRACARPLPLPPRQPPLTACMPYVRAGACREFMLNGWTDGCMRFMPREWVEAQGFVWADAILATALLALAALSYVMLAHMLRSWGDAQQNASTTGARASPTDGGHEPASAAGSGRSASCAEYGPVEGEIEGMTALMRASSQGDEACALELIAAGAQIDARDSQEGFTALLMASAMGAPAPARPHSPCAALACLARDRRSPPLPGPACTPELELPRTACTPPQTACTPP